MSTGLWEHDMGEQLVITSYENGVYSMANATLASLKGLQKQVISDKNTLTKLRFVESKIGGITKGEMDFYQNRIRENEAKIRAMTASQKP